MENNDKNRQEESSPASAVQLEDGRTCENCWMGEYKEIGYRYCGNTRCPLMPGAGN